MIPEKRKKALHANPSSGFKRRRLSLEDDSEKRKPLFRPLPPDPRSLGPDYAPEQQNPNSKTNGPFVESDDDSDNDRDATQVLIGNATVPMVENDPSDRHFHSATVEPAASALPGKALQDLVGIPPAKTSTGSSFRIYKKKTHTPLPYEQLIASRSTTAPGKASRSFYGIDIHSLLDEAAQQSARTISKPNEDREFPLPSIEGRVPKNTSRKGRTLLWTEKYRARKFTDLVGDERTHRDVLRWLKGWDPIVFPGSAKPKPKVKSMENEIEQRQQRKILMLAGPPGLGKTTLAHVCARQAGYEVVEVNASDERSRDIVKGRIKDCIGTENVKGINTKEAEGTIRKAGRPVCVIIDEVDGVVSGSGGSGEGGFIKALIDLVMLDQKNSNVLMTTSGNAVKPKKKGDRFRLLRPMILICNDVYHPALRPLRSSTVAEIIHIRRPPLDKVVARLKSVFDKEGIACDGDGVRRLCEATWGVSGRRENRGNASGTNEGDMRGVLVVGEWVAAKMRTSKEGSAKLTKIWVDKHMLEDLSHDGSGGRGLGRGGVKETVERVFLDGAGFPKAASLSALNDFGKIRDGDAVGVSEMAKRTAMDRLREMVDTSGESDRVVNDCFTTYPTQSWQDDTLLSKPDAAYEWLHFHDRVSAKVHVSQEWELGHYLSQAVLAFHSLFASPAKQSWSSEQKRWDDDEEEELPFSGPRADHAAWEALKHHKEILRSLQSSLSIPLHRCFKSAEDISTDLLPHLVKMLTPDVKPIVVGGSGDQRGIASVRKEGEREMVQRAVSVMAAAGVSFERTRVESNQNGVSSYIYRMEP